MFKFLRNIIKNGSLGLASLVFSSLIILGGLYFYTLISLPDVRKLKDISLQVPLRVYTNDHKLIAEFGEKKRIPITIDQVPQQFIEAILATEDQRFFEHKGVDFLGLVRAGISLLESGRKKQGASTITMQVARNFFLNRQKTFARKINEILLAFKLDKNFSKKEILELYLNKIYFGNRAYGIAAAAQIYYGKELQELTLEEMATLAGLPQAPSRDNPIINPEAARERRNHVLSRMLDNGYLNQTQYQQAIAAPITTNYHETKIEVSAPYVAEMARSIAVAQYQESAYEQGLNIYTTIDSNLQLIANQSLKNGILAYDQRHDYRGPEKKLPNDKQLWQPELNKTLTVNGLIAARVISFNEQNILAQLSNGQQVEITKENFSWANYKFETGDLIRVYQVAEKVWRLGQLPVAEGALVSLDPANGAILALVGGFSYFASNFNRATQAERQTGSAFKPFLYAAALDKDLTLANIINDAPIVVTNPTTNDLWRPQNDSQSFRGPMSLRDGLVFSRNLVSIRLLQTIGISYTANYLKNFGFEGYKEAPPVLSLALGAGSTTPLKMTAAYAVFASGGYKLTPFIIKQIILKTKDSETVVFETKPETIPELATINQLPIAPQVISSQNAYLITSVLQEVITRGTGRRAKVLARDDLAGKTGSTNDLIDTWFCGYNRDLVTTVWLGFDQPIPTHEYGSQAALPIWIEFMGTALKNKPSSTLPRPSEIIEVRIDPTTGLLAHPEQENAIFEIFTSGTEPTQLTNIDPQEEPNNQTANQSESEKVDYQLF